MENATIIICSSFQKSPFKKYIILPNVIMMKELTVTIKSVFDIMTPVTLLFDLYLYLPHQNMFLQYLHRLLLSKNNETLNREGARVVAAAT